MLYDAADRFATEGSDTLYVFGITDMEVLSLAMEYEADSEAFYQKYGLYSFTLVMQYDSSLDGTEHWNHTPQWDTEYGGPGTENAAANDWLDSKRFDIVSLFDLYSRKTYEENYSNIQDAIIRRDVPDGEYTFVDYYFDHENHSLSIRCRYYMEWETYDGITVGEKQSKYSEWSDIAVFGKGGNQVIPEEPTGYDAPILSNLTYVPPTEGQFQGSLSYTQLTPESVWMAGIYYTMTGAGGLDELETEICINDDPWQPYCTVNGWGDWSILNGERIAYYEEPRIEADSQVKLRARFTGTHSKSPWSNVIEINGGSTQENSSAAGIIQQNPHSKPVEQSSCSLCGFCPAPLKLCILVWIALMIAVVVIILLICTREKRCKTCSAALEKHASHCPYCGRPTGQS